jgi:hypothetical protein
LAILEEHSISKLSKNFYFSGIMKIFNIFLLSVVIRSSQTREIGNYWYILDFLLSDTVLICSFYVWYCALPLLRYYFLSREKYQPTQ